MWPFVLPIGLSTNQPTGSNWWERDIHESSMVECFGSPQLLGRWLVFPLLILYMGLESRWCHHSGLGLGLRTPTRYLKPLPNDMLYFWCSYKMLQEFAHIRDHSGHMLEQMFHRWSIWYWSMICLGPFKAPSSASMFRMFWADECSSSSNAWNIGSGSRFSFWVWKTKRNQLMKPEATDIAWFYLPFWCLYIPVQHHLVICDTDCWLHHKICTSHLGKLHWALTNFQITKCCVLKWGVASQPSAMSMREWWFTSGVGSLHRFVPYSSLFIHIHYMNHVGKQD